MVRVHLTAATLDAAAAVCHVRGLPHLVAKLDAADKPDSLITTVRGEGYRLAVDVERAHG